jgi:pyruvate/2-oxoglutarate dehydrogenase complex dihydrolipoamide acyltransferase (E2) component
MVRVSLDSKRISRLQDDNRKRRGEGGADAWANAAAGRRQGECNQWSNKGACSRKDNGCPFTHNDSDKGKNKGKGKGKGKRSDSSPPGGYRGDNGKGGRGKGKGKGKDDGGKGGYKGKGKGDDRGRSEQRPIKQPTRGNSPSGKQDVKLCPYYKQGKCNKGDKCDMWHPNICTFWKRGACGMGEKCIYVHQDRLPKVAAPATAQPKAKPKPKAKGKAKEEEPPPSKRAIAKAKAMLKKAGVHLATVAVFPGGYPKDGDDSEQPLNP